MSGDQGNLAGGDTWAKTVMLRQAGQTAGEGEVIPQRSQLSCRNILDVFASIMKLGLPASSYTHTYTYTHMHTHIKTGISLKIQVDMWKHYLILGFNMQTQDS